jgi:hypothetical protein
LKPPTREVFEGLELVAELEGVLLEALVGCALTFASEAKFEIEAKILFRLEAK